MNARSPQGTKIHHGKFPSLTTSKLMQVRDTEKNKDLQWTRTDAASSEICAAIHEAPTRIFWIWFSHSPSVEENDVMLFRLPPPHVDPRFLCQKLIRKLSMSCSVQQFSKIKLSP